MLVIVLNLLYLSSKSTHHYKKGFKASKCSSFVRWQGIKLFQYRVVEINTGNRNSHSWFSCVFLASSCSTLNFFRVHSYCVDSFLLPALAHRQPLQCSVFVVHSSQMHPVTSSFPGSPLQQFHGVILMCHYFLWQSRR